MRQTNKSNTERDKYTIKKNVLPNMIELTSPPKMWIFF